MDQMIGSPESSPTWPVLDFGSVYCEDFNSDACDSFHTASPGLDHAASWQNQNGHGHSVPRHLDNSQYSYVRLHNMAHDLSRPLDQRPSWNITTTETSILTADDHQSTAASNGESVFADSSSPETISTCSLSVPTPPDLGKPLQMVHYSYLKSQTKVSRPKKPPNKLRNKDTKSRGLGLRPDALKTDGAPKTVVKRDGKGKIAGTIRVFGLNQAVRGAVSTELQAATTVTRQFGACPRCRHDKTRCNIPDDLFLPCDRCAKLGRNLLGQPCIRFSLLELNLHRKGSTLNNDLYVWTTRKFQLMKLSQSQFLEFENYPPSSLSLFIPPRPGNPQTLYLTQDLGAEFMVTVSPFEVEPGDATGFNWEDAEGNTRKMEMPAYFISDLNEATLNIQEFARRYRSLYIEAYLSDSNRIIRRTFQLALGYVAFTQSQLVSDALSFWVATRLTEKPWRICCGASMLGVEPSIEPGNPWNGIVPVTPIMDTQIDDIVIRAILTPLTQRFLKGLKAKIDERKRENWLEIYLSIFIMMSNVEWILKDVVEYTNRHGMKSGRRGGTSLTQGYVHACKTMLAYFHFACNGSAPLSICWSEAASQFDDLTEDQIEYIQTIKQEVTLQESKLRNWKEKSMYTTEMYWVFQMMEGGWRGDVQHAGEVDDFTEEDFLTS